MPLTGRRTLFRGAMAAAAAGGPAFAQDLPGGIVRLLVGFPPGGGTDVMARLIAEQLRKRGNLRGIVVENRPGATGTLACEALKHAPPDGTPPPAVAGVLRITPLANPGNHDPLPAGRTSP
jgi:tripartite-type tricarboxylate transporter receptor subunit TctC